jgi:hypothetical protein
MSQVTLSDYIQGRRINNKLYDRLIKSIETKCKKLFEKQTDVEVVIGMSAKYQTPYIGISKEDDGGIPDNVGRFEREIIEAIEDVGFRYSESEEKLDSYYINFND